MSRPSSPSAANCASSETVGGSRTAPTAARWTAIAIAVAAVIDPTVPLATRARPALRIVGNPDGPAMAVTRQLREAGFVVDEPVNEAATVLVGERPALSPTSPVESGRASARQALPVWVLDTSPTGSGVRLVAAAVPATRLPGQAVEVRVTLDARGLAGKASEVVLDDAGIVVASARHEWKTDGEQWSGTLHYLPPGAAGGRLRVKAGDGVADVAVPPVRGPLRTLVVEAGVTWPALFVRRAIEGEPAFAVAAVQRASEHIATRAGAPPAALTRDTLAPFDVALIGAPANLTGGDVDALRWFVEERGGVAVLIPDQRPGGRYLELLGGPALEPRALETPVRLGQGLQASELLVTRHLPAGSRALAATGSGEAVVFSTRRGAGAVIFSGALDAWRHRASENDAFGRFWRRVIAEEAMAVPPVLEVSAEPSLVSIGASTRVRARLRATELPAEASVPSSPIPDPPSPIIDVETVSARAVSPGARVDEAVRLWPTAEPGVYEGEWRPPAAGDYNLTVTAGERRGDAPVAVAASVLRASTSDADGLALVARTSGGRVFRADDSAALVADMKEAFPARPSVSPVRLMRSPWWVVPFAGLLCLEWAHRRRHVKP